MDTDSETGFMIIELNLNTVQQNIKKGNFHIIKRKRLHTEILGFVEVSDNLDGEILEKLDWIDFMEEERFAQKKKKYIDKIVIKKELRGKKIGSMLYDFLFEKYKDLLLYAFVIIKPYSNEASMNFHLKKGFVKSAIYSVDEFCGLKNYKSILMIKTKN